MPRNHTAHFGPVAALLSGLLASSTAAQEAPTAATPLLLPDAIARALARDPSVVAVQQRVRQAEYRLTGAQAFPNAIIDVGHGQTLTDPGASGNDQDLSITQRFDLFGQRRLRGDQAQKELLAARASLTQAQAEVVFRVRSAYVQARTATAEVELARQTLALAQTFQRLAQAQYDAGQVPIASVLRSEIEVENADQAVLTAETAARIQRATLNTALNYPPEVPVTLPPVGEVVLHTFDFAELRREAEQQPALKAAEATLAARRSAVAVARAAARPDFVVTGTHDQLQDWPGGNTLRAGFTFPLFDRGVIRAAVGEARASAAEQEANVLVLKQQAALDVTSAYYLLEQARELVTRTGGAQLQRATRLYQLAQTSYSEGLSTYLDLLDAQQVLRTAHTSYLRALAAYESAEAALQKSLGAPLPSPASSSPVQYELPTFQPAVTK